VRFCKLAINQCFRLRYAFSRGIHVPIRVLLLALLSLLTC